MKRFVFALTVTWCLLLSSAARADDLFPPLWRDQPGTTWAMWEFFSNDPNPAPDDGNNPYGAPSTSVFTGFGQQWLPEHEGAVGVWPLSGTITVNIPNRPEPGPSKEIQVQLTWLPQAPGNIPTVWETTYNEQSEVLNEITLLNGWIHTTYLITLPENPDFEIVRIDGGILVDELVIDTICIPEPASLGLLAFTGLMVLRRRPR